jgi:hypothetical protein
MPMNANRDEDEMDDYDAPDDFAGPEDDPTAYWRRRFIILAGGIAVLGLCVWLFPGSRPAPARTPQSASASMAALARHGALPSAAYGTAWLGPAARASAQPSAKAKKTRQSKAHHPSRRPSPADTASAAASAAASRCAPAGIVLSLFTSQDSYPQRVLPTFNVYAVSTSATACTLAYGPGSVRVVVTRHGHVVWDSARCKPPAAGRVRFTLGVPQELTIAWNRRATGPSGCAGSLSAGAAGTFDAVAMTAGQSSPVRAFKLAR